MTIIIGIKTNTILSTIVASILLFPLITSIPYLITQATMIPNESYAQKSSTNLNSSSIAIPFDASPNMTIKNNATEIVNIVNNTNKTVALELGSNNTVFSKNQFKNESAFLSNTINGTNANITSISSAAVQGSPRVTGDFNGDGADDLAVGVPFEDKEIGGSCITNLSVSGVTASGNDGNVPQNVLDNNYGTRWSSNGIGQFITTDLGSTQKICSVGVAWYNGNARQYHFVIATSTDGTTFTNVLSSDSSGTTTSSEIYTIPSTNARYIKVTVNGNTQNNWASITELDIFGPTPSQTIFNSGAVNVIYGSSDGLSATGLSAGNGRTDQIWTQTISGGLEPFDAFGSALATGDFNKDGFSDLAIGVPSESIGTSIPQAGAVNVIYGSSSGLTASGNQIWTQDSPDIKNGAEPFDWFGKALAAGDFNKDGFSDLAIGVPREGISSVNEVGAVNVVYGSLHGLNATAPPNEFWLQFQEDEDGDWFGATLATGDFNNDTIADLAIGVPREDVGNIRDAGEVDVLYGTLSGLRQVVPSGWSQNSTNVEDDPEVDDGFGSALATGDFNKDGISDLAIGVPLEDVGTIGNAGAVNVIYGSSPVGLWPSEVSPGNGRPDQIWTQNSTNVEDDVEDGDVFGDALATGDFNKDGISDLAIGVPAEDVGTVEVAGAVNVIYGSSQGLSPVRLSVGDGRPDQIWTQNSTNVEDDVESIDVFGDALATGDFNKDGISDLAIGVPLEDVGTIGNAGAVNVIYGSIGIAINSGGLSATVPLGGNGRADQIWSQNSPGIEDDAEASDNFGNRLG
jgi:F5/8 type C domain/FG-GAP repeat